MKASKIVVVGSSNTDMIIKMDKIPVPGETILGGEFSIAAGGKGANQAVAAARSGGNVSFVACLGQDMFGQQAIDGFVSDKINIDYIFTDKKAASGVALIFVDKKGENSIAVASGANYKLTPKHIDKAKRAITAAQILVMQLETPLDTVTAAAKLARKHGVKVILNPAPAQFLSEDLLRNISILTPNETETELLTGIKVHDKSSADKASKILLEKGLEAVLITLGPRGVFLATPNTGKMVPGFKVKAIDTTAAGDVFNGALAVYLSEENSLEASIRFANAAGALSVTRLGAQPSAPRRPEIERFLEAQK
jgi:ribokinase